MRTAADLPGFSELDRLGLSTFASVLVHLVLILGVTFTVPELPLTRETAPTLEITLVQSESREAPKEADFLAQANQRGGGRSEKRELARSPIPARELTTAPPRPPTASPPRQRRRAGPRRTPELLVQTAPSEKALQRPKPARRPKTGRTEVGLTSERRKRERARLAAEISSSWQEYQKRPWHRFISARTREYKYAAYMEAWRIKVERIGNLNYPEEAKRRGLTGELVLDVALNPDGTIYSVTIQRPSKYKVLDDAAVRIVKLAAPFAPFPENIRKETDILHITRTWQFLHGSRLASR